MEIHNKSVGCTPWNFPFTDENHVMCDPWQNIEIADLMAETNFNLHRQTCLPGIKILLKIMDHKRFLDFSVFFVF